MGSTVHETAFSGHSVALPGGAHGDFAKRVAQTRQQCIVACAHVFAGCAPRIWWHRVRCREFIVPDPSPLTEVAVGVGGG